MAYAHDFLARSPYRRVFDIPPAKAAVQKGRNKSAEERMAECEFGPIGRDPRYPSGWFIIPTLLIGAAILGFLF